MRLKGGSVVGECSRTRRNGGQITGCGYDGRRSARQRTRHRDCFDAANANLVSWTRATQHVPESSSVAPRRTCGRCKRLGCKSEPERNIGRADESAVSALNRIVG